MPHNMRPDWSVKGLLAMIKTLEEKTGDLSSQIMVEIGSYTGQSTEIFAQRFKHVFSIDPYDEGQHKGTTDAQILNFGKFNEVENEFIKRCSKYKNITKIKRTSNDAVELFKPETLDFVYIDGLHTYEQCRLDIINYMPFIKKGRYLGGHDWDWCPGVKKAIQSTIKKPHHRFDDSSWLYLVN